MTPNTPLPTEARSAILGRQIAKYIKRGYRVTARTPTTAQLDASRITHYVLLQSV